jgi:hypothetical protein
MHTAEALAATDFQYRNADRTRAGVNPTPDVAVSDRLGVVIRDPFDGLGAATFVLSRVTDFYEEYRAETEDFYAYPDYFTFQSDGRFVDYLWFDIWPDHKNVRTAPEAEAVLRAINDRAIDALLVPDGPAGDPDFEAVTREGFERRIDDCYLYAPDGELDDPSFSIGLSCDPTWEWIERTLDTIDDDYTDLRARRKREWRARIEDGTLLQDFRRIDPEDALRYLPDEA